MSALDSSAPVTAEAWAAHRRAMLNGLPPQLLGGTLPDVLLSYQKERIAAIDAHQLVVDEKSRRIGATWGVAAAAVLTSAAQKSAQGMDTLYLGYNLDMAREFIDTCAMWARAFMPACSEVEEFLFHEQDEKGADRSIAAFRITFASGFQIVALSSRPRSLRGRQGFVILDEFAFHDDADELLKAAMALLIWGGKVLVISTHDGEDNPFNQLVQQVREKRRPGVVIRTTFDDAIEQGLYERICLVTGRTWTPEGEAEWRENIKQSYGADAAEELDVVPSKGSGVYLTSAIIKSCMSPDLRVIRMRCPEGFELQPEGYRISWVDDFLAENIDPILKMLNRNLQHSYGWDFGRSGDLSVLFPLQRLENLVRRAPFILELRNVPFKQQEQILYHVVDRLPRFQSGKHDARGNGQFLAEYAQQKYGASRIEAVMLSQAWYLANMPALKTAFEERTLEIPLDEDIRSDFRQIVMERGIPKVPDSAKTQGTDGGQRHGDAAVAGVLAICADEANIPDYGYTPLSALKDEDRKSYDPRDRGDMMLGRRGSIL